MANPRIFVSSTCYDLYEVRDILHSFIESLCYHPVFSDKNDVFYSPDIHTHDSCLKEIENCNVFILIIGGRFGGEYYLDDEKSIVNIEYETAKKLNLPIFTFIKREVYEDHRIYNHNKRNKPEFYDKIEYNSINNQKYSMKIFEFIDLIRKSDENNAIFTFEYSRDIKEILLKQFAGMFYDFLWERKKKKDNEKGKDILIDLAILGKKTEEIIEKIYKKVDIENAEKNLELIEEETNARRFFSNIIKTFGVSIPHDKPEKIRALLEVNDKENWIDYLLRTGKFTIIDINTLDNNIKEKALQHNTTKRILLYTNNENVENSSNVKNYQKLEKYFNSFKKLSESKRKEIINGVE